MHGSKKKSYPILARPFPASLSPPSMIDEFEGIACAAAAARVEIVQQIFSPAHNAHRSQANERTGL
jgi:hypothetical protein